VGDGKESVGYSITRYRPCPEDSGVVAAQCSVIEHDDTWCSRCMQLESAKRLVDGVVVIEAGRLTKTHGPPLAEG